MELFRPGMLIFIQRTGAKAKRPCILLGQKGKEFLFVEAPFVGERAMFEQVGEKCVARCLHEGKAYGFRSQVVKILYDPFPMVILKYPENFEIMELREKTRLSCSLPVRLKPFGKASGIEDADADSSPYPVANLPYQASIADLSESGFRIALPIHPSEPGVAPPESFPKKIPVEGREAYHLSALQEVYQVGVPVRMNFALPSPGLKNFANVGGMICWVKTSVQYYFVGMKLQEAETDLIESVQNTITFQRRYFSPKFNLS